MITTTTTAAPTEELKRSLREELTQQIKAELRIELLDGAAQRVARPGPETAQHEP